MSKIILTVVMAIIALTSIHQAFANKEKGSNSKKITLDPNKTMKVTYRNFAWNHDSKVIDHASIILVDANSKHVVQIQMQETEPDSGVFYGIFAINWSDVGHISPELYIPPQNLFESNDGIKKIPELIRKQEIKRKPIFTRENEKKIQEIAVFDTKEQALKAFEEYQSQIVEEKEAAKPQPTPIVDTAAIEAARLAAIQAEKDRLARETAAREADRKRMEELEIQKAEERKRQQEAMAAAEIAKRKAQAIALAEEGMNFYTSSDYVKAEEKFSQSIELDPKNSKYYYQYAVTLYRNEKYNKSLVYLKMTEDKDVNPIEKNYYMGLVHMRLKEYPLAIAKFKQVKNTNDKTMGPSAAFYMGLVQFSEDKYEEAKNEFQYVLDNSSDPRLDEQAENYIEKISNIQRFKANQQKKLLISGMYGFMYDSNVQMLPDALKSLTAPTDIAGFHHIFNLGLEYRPIYTENHEFSIKLNNLYMYTWDTSFKSNATLQNLDPWVMTLTTPYKYKGQVFGKGFQLEATPGYEIIKMNADGIGGQEEILRSTYFNFSNLFVMNENRFDTWKIGYRIDNSLTTVTSADDDSSANKINLGYSTMHFLNKKKTQGVSGDVGYTLNNAKGKNQTNNKIDLGVGYNAPWISEWSWNTRLAYYMMNYPNHASGRKDTNISANLGCSKTHSELLTSAVTFNYTLNNSTAETYKYNKMSLMYNIILNTSL